MASAQLLDGIERAWRRVEAAGEGGPSVRLARALLAYGALYRAPGPLQDALRAGVRSFEWTHQEWLQADNELVGQTRAIAGTVQIRIGLPENMGRVPMELAESLATASSASAVHPEALLEVLPRVLSLLPRRADLDSDLHRLRHIVFERRKLESRRDTLHAGGPDLGAWWLEAISRLPEWQDIRDARVRWPLVVTLLRLLDPKRNENRIGGEQDLAEVVDAIALFHDSTAMSLADPGEPTAIMERKFEGTLRAEPQLAADFERLVGRGADVALAFFDIDRFKDLNTRFTETVVDREFLLPFRRWIRDFVHGRGYAYSVGGDEFVLLLANVAEAEATLFCERLLDGIRTTAFVVSEQEIAVTVSMGLALRPVHGEALSELRGAANRAEGLSKQAGRDRLTLAGLRK